MIDVRYFARYREMLGVEGEALELTAETGSTEKLKQFLAERGESWADVFVTDLRVLVAVNQDMVSADTTLKDGDEVAFFPPVTGG